jgi:3-oxoacyl-[acyl-carrier protein] reductase
MKNALVTGGSGGIGSAICKKLASDNIHVIIHFNSNEQKARTIQEEIINGGGSAEIMQFDVASSQDIVETLENWKKDNPESHINIIVNNAGISSDNLMVWMETDEWDKVINTNLNSFYHVTSTLLKDMIINKWGRIINIVSLSGVKGLPGQTNYSAAKAGVIGATKALAQEVGKKKITVNAIAPGYIKTEMINHLNEKELKKLIPVSRFGLPEEVAELVGFMASDSSSYITGEVININGGLNT